jgi:hypothetical protein
MFCNTNTKQSAYMKLQFASREVAQSTWQEFHIVGWFHTLFNQISTFFLSKMSVALDSWRIDGLCMAIGPILINVI